MHRNAGKDVLTVEGGQTDPVHELLAGADLVVVSDGWAANDPTLAPVALAARHPHLVVVALTPFGLTGPAADWTATELVAQAMGGVVYRSGEPDLPPVSAPGSFAEDVGAVTAALAGLLALTQGGPDGVGQLVDVSSVLALAQCTDMAMALWSMLGTDQVRAGAGLYPLFRCTDGLARIVLPMTPADWRRLVEWLGSPPEWTGPGWDAAMLGPDERALIMARLPERFAPYTRDEITAQGDAAGLRVTPVLTPAEVLANEHTAARGTFVDLPVANGRAGAVVAGLFGVNGIRAAIAGPARAVAGAPVWRPRPGPRPGATTGGLPLAGITVLEVGSGVAAPEAGRVLGEWGARVIKVESRQRPDFQRMVMGGEMNPAFATPNRTKLGFGADLGTSAGRELVTRLLPHVDVVIENNATGVIDRLGLGWETLHAANPRLVLVGSQLYGDRGPWAARKGYGPSARAVGGLTWLWAHGPDAPRGIQTIHPDHLAGRLCAIGALAGLRHRGRTGEGVRVDVAQFEAVSALLGDLLLAESLEPGAAQPTGNTSGVHAPWGLYRCADDAGVESWLAVCVTDDAAWRNLVSVAGDALTVDAAWTAETARRDAAVEVDRSMAAWLADADAAATEAALQSAGVAAGQVLHPRIQASHPQFVARGYPVPMDQPGSGPLVVEGPAFVGGIMGGPRCSAAPALGEHTVLVCREVLGLDDDEIAALVEAGAIDPPT